MSSLWFPGEMDHGEEVGAGIFLKQPRLEALFSNAFLGNEDWHLGCNPISPAQIVKYFPKTARLLRLGEIPLAEGFFVTRAQAGEESVELVVIVSALMVTQGHAKGGQDVPGSVLGSECDDLPDVLLVIFDEGEHWHQGDSR